MRTLHFTPLFTIILHLMSCINNNHITYPPSMLQAENCMEAHPDSASTLLQSMADSIAGYPEETQMYWHLLTIQAKDKQHIVQTSDSLINSIVKFYERYGDKTKLMMSYYYQGSTYRDMNDAPQALKAFQQALATGASKDDLPIKVHNQMGTLFMRQGLYDEGIRANRNAIELYIRQDKATKASHAWRNIARMYSFKNQPDSALFHCQNACQTALADKDSTRFYDMLGEIGEYYYQTGRNDSAKLILKYAEKQPLIREKKHIYIMLGHIYKAESKQDSACHYYRKTIECGDIHHSYHGYKNLYDAETQRGNYRLATEYIGKALTLKDSIDQITQTEAIAKINSLYNYQHTEAENAQLQLEQEKHKELIMMQTLIILGTVLSSVLIFFRQKAKRLEAEKTTDNFRKEARKRFEKSEATIRDNEKKMEELGKQLQQAKEERDLLKAEQLEIQQKLLQNHNEEITLQQKESKLRIDTFRRTAIYKEFHQTAKEESINMENKQNAKKWEELKEAINTAYPDFTERIRVLCPTLSDKEAKVCLLTKTGITPSGIATILKCSRQAITNIRVRLFKKIASYNPDITNFDQFIESL